MANIRHQFSQMFPVLEKNVFLSVADAQLHVR